MEGDTARLEFALSTGAKPREQLRLVVHVVLAESHWAVTTTEMHKELWDGKYRCVWDDKFECVWDDKYNF